ncbi:MAG: 50S ribosomal protein L24 [Firmicutes bacterium]|nr:50S ribosomal protein L24 [Bacillota bacterium]
MHVRKEDTVEVISGKDRGKRGRVLVAYPAKERVLVEGVNQIKRHTKPNPAYPKGGIITKEAPIHVSNVMIVCKHCNRRTRIAHRFLDDGKKIRVCKHCGQSLDD